MIRSFADRATRRLFEGGNSKVVPGDIRERAETKLAVLDAATSLGDLEVPPGNRLEALGGRRRGQYSIRINRRYRRVCFRFDEEHGDAYEVEMVDYH
jgi:proteic killer suppression protein